MLSLKHYHSLVEHLSRHANVWRNLGIALKFLPQDLDIIQACIPLMARSPYSHMERLVEEWLERKHPHAAPPTLANLLEALNSHTVGLGTLAKQIQDSQVTLNHSNNNAVRIFEIASMSDQDVVTHIKDITIDENTPVSLEVTTTAKCQWKKSNVASHRSEITADFKTELVSLSDTDNAPIESQLGMSSSVDAFDYNKTYYKPVLHIPKADIDMDGTKYTCEMHKNNKNIGTASVTLRVSCPQLDEFKETLALIYTAQPEIPEETWPPVSNKVYINLALIKQQVINCGEEYARLTIRGDIDDILHHKEKIEYKNIFDGLRSGMLLLIEGRPGSGKTTFVRKIVRDWVAGQTQGPRRLVLLVSLRVLNNLGKPITLKDILKLFNLKVSEKIIEDRGGKGLCFIFDGLDEFSPLEGEKSIVYSVMNKTFLPQSIVIVASRPAALVKLRKRAQKVIEVIGFQKNQILEYIESYPFACSSKVDKLKSYLVSHPNIMHMCYLPIHTSMVAFLFKVMGEVPRTETDIYAHFTRFTVMRSLSKHRDEQELESVSLNKLSGKEADIFHTVCEIALEKTILNKQVVDQDEMKLHLKSKDDVSLGLVTVDRTAGLYGFKNIYTFLHLTYQEYLAAHHISTFSSEDQHQLIKQYGGKEHMQVVWKFYCGLVNFEGHEHNLQALFSRINKTVLSDIQFAYESQQQTVCDCIIKEMNAHVLLEDIHLVTTDFTALGYLLANSSEPVKLSLINCNINIEAVEALLKELEEKPLLLHILKCELNMNNLKCIKKLLTYQHSLEQLKLEKKSIYTSLSLDSYDFSDIISTSFANIKYFTLTNMHIGAETLTEVLQFCRGLKSLVLNESIQYTDIEILLTGLTKLKELESCSCSVFHSEILRIAVAHSKETTIVFKSSVSSLFILGDKGDYFQTLAIRDPINKRLSDAWLKPCCEYFPQPIVFALQQNSRAYYNGLMNIAESVSDFSALEKLLINYVTIDNRAATFASKLIHCTMLHELDLSNNQATQDGITTILSNLKHCSNIQRITLNNTNVGVAGTHVLVSCLPSWPLLKELHLSGCLIGEEGAIAIADSLGGKFELQMVGASSNDLTIRRKPHVIDQAEETTLYEMHDQVDINEFESALTRILQFKNLEKSSLFVGNALSVNITTDTSEINVSSISGSGESSVLHMCGIKGNYHQTLMIKYRNTNISDVCLKACSEYFPQPSILALHQYWYGYQDDTATFAENISNFGALEKLSLRGITINSTTALLATKLSQCLREVDLSNNLVENHDGFVSTITNLRNFDLLKLFLSKTKIKTEGALVLASHLQNWPRLQELHLNDCLIKEEGARAIVDNLQYCTELYKLNLKNNEVSSDTLQMIKSSCKKVPESNTQQSIQCCTLL